MILVIGLRNQKVVVPKSDEPSAFLMLIFLAPLPTSKTVQKCLSLSTTSRFPSGHLNSLNDNALFVDCISK